MLNLRANSQLMGFDEDILRYTVLRHTIIFVSNAIHLLTCYSPKTKMAR